MLWLAELAGRLIWPLTERGYTRFVVAMVTVTLSLVAIYQTVRRLAGYTARPDDASDLVSRDRPA